MSVAVDVSIVFYTYAAYKHSAIFHVSRSGSRYVTWRDVSVTVYMSDKLYSKRTSGQTNNSGHFTPGIMFTVKQFHLTSVQSA